MLGAITESRVRYRAKRKGCRLIKDRDPWRKAQFGDGYMLVRGQDCIICWDGPYGFASLDYCATFLEA